MELAWISDIEGKVARVNDERVSKSARQIWPFTESLGLHEAP